MTDVPTRTETERGPTVNLWRQPGVAYYLAVCLGALGLIYLVLLEHELDAAWCAVPALIGLVGIPTCWSKTPVILLLVLGVVIEGNRVHMSQPGGGLRVLDLLLCMGALAFVVGHYRLQGLLKELLPTVRASAKQKAGPESRRAAHLATPNEVGRLLLWLPAWAITAQLVSLALPTQLGNPGLQPLAWRAVVLTWSAGAVLFVTTGILDYYARRHLSRDEAQLYLQDVLWRETRGEQRTLNRWLAWERLGKPLGIADRLVDYVALAVLLIYLVILFSVIQQLYRAMAGGG